MSAASACLKYMACVYTPDLHSMACACCARRTCAFVSPPPPQRSDHVRSREQVVRKILPRRVARLRALPLHTQCGREQGCRQRLGERCARLRVGGTKSVSGLGVASKWFSDLRTAPRSAYEPRPASPALEARRGQRMGQRLPRAFDRAALEQPGPLSTGTGTLGGVEGECQEAVSA